jgi:hypothetical protein
MTSKEAVKLAYKEFQKDFEDGEAINQWLTNVIEGLKQAEKDLEMLETFKKHLVIDENNDVWLKIEKDNTGYLKVEGIKWGSLGNDK